MRERFSPLKINKKTQNILRKLIITPIIGFPSILFIFYTTLFIFSMKSCNLSSLEFIT